MAEQGLYVGRLFARYDIEGEEQAYAEVERRLKQARGKFKLDVPVKVTGGTELDKLRNRFNVLKLEAASGTRPLRDIQRELGQVRTRALQASQGVSTNSTAFNRYITLARQATTENNRLTRSLNPSAFTRNANAVNGLTNTLRGLVAGIISAYAIRRLAGGVDEATQSFYRGELALKLYEREMANLGNSAENSFGHLENFARELHTTAEDLAQPMTQLVRYGGDFEAAAGLARIGAASALAAGKDVATGVDAIAQAIVSENSAMLNSIGISGNLSTAFQKFAKATGVTVDELSNAQKVQAAYNYLAEETRGEVEALAENFNGLGGSINSFEVAQARASRAVGQEFEPAMVALYTAGAELYKIFGEDIVPILADKLIPIIEENVEQFSNFITRLTEASDAGDEVRESMVASIAPLLAVGRAFVGVGQGASSAVSYILGFVAGVGGAIGTLSVGVKAELEDIKADFQAFGEMLKNPFTFDYSRIGQKAEGGFDFKAAGVAFTEAAERYMSRAASMSDAARESFAGVGSSVEDATKFFDAFIRQADSAGDSTRTLTPLMNNLGNSLGGSGGGNGKSVKEGAEGAADALRELQGELNERYQGAQAFTEKTRALFAEGLIDGDKLLSEFTNALDRIGIEILALGPLDTDEKVAKFLNLVRLKELLVKSISTALGEAVSVIPTGFNATVNPPIPRPNVRADVAPARSIVPLVDAKVQQDMRRFNELVKEGNKTVQQGRQDWTDYGDNLAKRARQSNDSLKVVLDTVQQLIRTGQQVPSSLLELLDSMGAGVIGLDKPIPIPRVGAVVKSVDIELAPDAKIELMNVDKTKGPLNLRNIPIPGATVSVSELPVVMTPEQTAALEKYRSVLVDIDGQLGRSKTQFESWRDSVTGALKAGTITADDFETAMAEIATLETLDTISTVLTGLQDIASIDFSSLQSGISGVSGALGSIASIIPGIGPAIGAIITQAGGLLSTVIGFFTGASRAAAELKKETDALRDSFNLLSANSFDKLVNFDGAKLAAKQAGLDMAQAMAQGFESGSAVDTFRNVITNIIRQAFIMSPEVQNLIVRWTKDVQRLMEGGLTDEEAVQLQEMGEVYARAIDKSLSRAEQLIKPAVKEFPTKTVGELIGGFEDAIRSGFSGGNVAEAIQSEVERQVIEGVQFSLAMLDNIAELVGLIKKALEDEFISSDEVALIQAAQDVVTRQGEAMQRELAKVGIGTGGKVGELVLDPIAQSLEQAIRDGLGSGDVATALRESVQQQILAGIVLPPEVLAGIANLGRTVTKYLADGFISADERQTLEFMQKHLNGMLDGIQDNLTDLGIGVSESVKEKVTDPLAESFEAGIRSGLGSGDVGEGLRESVKQQILAGLVLPPEVLEGIKKMSQLVNKYIADGFVSADERETLNRLNDVIDDQLKGVQANLQKLGIGIKKEVKQKVANPLKDALINGVRSGLGAGDVGDALKDTIKQQILAGIKLPREVLRAIAKLTRLISKALKDGFVSEAEQSEIDVLSAFVDKALDGVQKNLRKLGIGVKKKVANPIKDSLVSAVRSGLGSGDLKKALKDAVREQILAGLKLPPEVRKAISRLAQLISKSLRDGFVNQAEQKEMNALNKFIDVSLDGVQKNLRGMGIGIKQKVANPLKDSLINAVRSGLGDGKVKTALRDSVKNEILAGLVLPPQVRRAIAQLARAVSNAMRDGFISKGEKRQINALENSINNSLKGVQRNLKTLGIGDIGRNIGKEIKDGILGGLEQGLSGDMEGLIKGILSAELVKVVASMPAMKKYAERAGKIMADLAKGGITEAEKRIIDRLAREGSKILDPYKSSFAYLNAKTQPLTGGAFGQTQTPAQGPAISLGFGSANASVGMSTQLIDFVGQFNIGAQNVRQGGADILAASKELRAIARSGRFEAARAGGR